jgi:N-acylneuraminate cytidylyltransferase|tara:strand:+ start:1776 stop:2459 length:684 start_codon:yes stop_codon:yes gene_type:complete
MKVLSIIPARRGSKGIPLKNLVMLNRKPLLYYTVTASLKSKIINKTIVSTDNKKIGKIALKLGAEVIYRPKKLATDTTALEPVIEHVLNYLNVHQGYDPEIIVILQNTSPLRTAKHIDEALTLMKRQNYDSILSGFSIHTFLWKKSKKTIIPLDYNPKKRPNRQNIHEQLFENGAIFATKTRCFTKNNCRISGKIGFYKMPLENSYNVDSYDDLRLIRKFLKILNKS